MLRSTRHDNIAFIRQRYLAIFLLILLAIVIVLSAAISYSFKWHPLTRDRLDIVIPLSVVAALSLLLAAGAVGGCRDMWENAINKTPAARIHRDSDFFARKRMVFFYAGVYLSLVLFVVVIEQTGGVITSPYTAPFVALVLTGQQLSRFKTQASFLISTGIALTIIMRIYESVVGVLNTPSSPRILVYLLIAISLVAAGLIANVEKDHNYLIEGKQHLPTHARVYKDAHGIWHYVIYCQRHQLDPIAGSDTTKEGTRDSESEVYAKVEADVRSMYQAAGWGQPSFNWSPRELGNSFTVSFPVNEAGVPKTNQLASDS
jgi:hypothetical protein